MPRRAPAAASSPQSASSAAPAPRVKIDLSPRLWLVAFLSTSIFYLVQTDAEQIAAGRWPLLAPWLHTSALPVFAVLSVLVALAWSACRELAARVRALRRRTRVRSRTGSAALRRCRYAPRAPTTAATPPRRLFGLAFETRPPPLPA